MNDARPTDTQLIDRRRISRLGPVLSAGLPAGESRVHAEVLHQLCLADGLLELLDWSRQGVGADPLACMWLSSLRWNRLITGGFPEGAPQPPARDLDAALLRLLRDGGLSILEGTGETSLAGLASGEMAYPSSPAQPDEDDAAALIRVVPIGLVPYVEEEMRRSWVRQAVSLTQGDPELISAAERLMALAHAAASGQLADPAPALEEILREAGAPPEAAEILRRQLSACAADEEIPGHEADTGHETAPHPAVAAFAQEWERVTRPA